MDDEVRVGTRRCGRGETYAERARDRGAMVVDVHELHVRRRHARRQPGDQAPNGAGADDRHAIARVRTRVPQHVDRGFQIRGEHGARRRHVVGQQMHRRRRHDVARLVRIENEDVASFEIARPAFHAADVRVPVLDWRRELALLKRRAHAAMLAGRHPAEKDQRLGAAADAAVQRADDDLVWRRRRQLLRADLAAPRLRDPERARLECGHAPILAGP